MWLSYSPMLLFTHHQVYPAHWHFKSSSSPLPSTPHTLSTPQWCRNMLWVSCWHHISFLSQNIKKQSNVIVTPLCCPTGVTQHRFGSKGYNLTVSIQCAYCDPHYETRLNCTGINSYTFLLATQSDHVQSVGGGSKPQQQGSKKIWKFPQISTHTVAKMINLHQHFCLNAPVANCHEIHSIIPSVCTKSKLIRWLSWS